MAPQLGAPTKWLPRITRKRAVLAVIVIAVLLAVVDLGVGWYYAGEIESGGFRVDHEPHELKIEVIEVQADRIVIASQDDGNWNDPGPLGPGRRGRLRTAGRDPGRR